MFKISVVIPAYNAAQTLPKTIEGIINQSYKGPIEILVVDDGSSDDTAKVVSKYNSIKYIFQSNSGPASARNKGIYNSTGNIIFFVDSDCIPHHDWIEKVIIFFNKKNISAVAGSYGIANPDNKLAYCIYREIVFRHNRFFKSGAEVFGSYNVAIRKEVLEKIGGFDEHYTSASGEDNDLSYRLRSAGYIIKFSGESVVDHFHPENVQKYLKDQLNHGFWRVMVYLKHPNMAQGDGYTFWKDIIEPIIVLFAVGTFFLALLGWLGFQIPLITIGVLALIELFYGMLILNSFSFGLFHAGVMFFRSFARTVGFLKGLCCFLPGKLNPNLRSKS